MTSRGRFLRAIRTGGHQAAASAAWVRTGPLCRAAVPAYSVNFVTRQMPRQAASVLRERFQVRLTNPLPRSEYFQRMLMNNFRVRGNGVWLRSRSL